jgi:hypothetical protein
MTSFISRVVAITEQKVSSGASRVCNVMARGNATPTYIGNLTMLFSVQATVVANNPDFTIARGNETRTWIISRCSLPRREWRM